MKIVPAWGRIALALSMLILAPKALLASTVLHVDVDFLLNEAALIVECEVLSSEAMWNPGHTYITTFITFKVKDSLKGRAQSSTITLEFSGGVVGDTRLEVGSMVYPSVGEAGIYFFENPGERFVNPLVGWGQGHFRLQKDQLGVERVLTESGRPVLGLDMDGALDDTAGTTPAPVNAPFSHGVAKGVKTGKRDDGLEAAMEKKQFKDALKARLATLEGKSTPAPGSIHKP